MQEYTKENVTEAGKVVLEAAGIERRATEAMLDTAGMTLPKLLQFAAQEYFVWGEGLPSGPTREQSAVVLVQKALKQLSRKGAFEFQDPKS
jgi:hypothetical protein